MAQNRHWMSKLINSEKGPKSDYDEDEKRIKIDKKAVKLMGVSNFGFTTPLKTREGQN